MIIKYRIKNKQKINYILFWGHKFFGVKMTKIKVGVLMGGRSIEREVSFNSGRTVCNHLDTQIYSIVPIFQRSNGDLYILPNKFLYRGKISDFEDRLEKEAEKISWDDLKNLIDFVYIATHGRFAEDGTLQGMLEVLRIPYLGSKVAASAFGMDKIFQKSILKQDGINTAKDIVIKASDIKNTNSVDKEKILEKIKSAGLDFPLVVKPQHEGSSLGVSIVNNKEELFKAIIKAKNIDPQKTQDVLVEEKIEGMEFSCLILIDYKTGEPIILPPTEIVPESANGFWDYEQKYMPGKSKKFTPARCSEKEIDLIQKTCIKTMKSLGMTTLARIDGFLTKDNRVIITDPNTLSGMAPSSILFRQAAEIDMSHTAVINHLIKSELVLKNKNLDFELEFEKNNNMENKLRVAVLLGGRSNEKEISLESGRNIIYKLSPEKYVAMPVFVDANLDLYIIDQKLLVRNSTSEITLGLKPEMKIGWSDLKKLSDFVFIALHGGEGENGSVQGALEMLDLPYNGSSVLASALCMDKFKTNNFLRSKGFDVPAGILVEKTDFELNREQTLNLIEKNIGFPMIIKPHDDGCSVMVQKAKNKKDLETCINNIFSSNKNFALVEECIVGMELTVGVTGNNSATAMPPSQTITAGDILSIEEKFLPGAGENQTPANLEPERIKFVQNIIEQVYMTVGCKGYSRIDCFYQNETLSKTGKQRLVIIEINTLPGMTPATCIFHQATEIGMMPMEFIDLIVSLGLEEHAKSVEKMAADLKFDLSSPGFSEIKEV